MQLGWDMQIDVKASDCKATCAVYSYVQIILPVFSHAEVFITYML